jgi:hypothetical protein
MGLTNDLILKSKNIATTLLKYNKDNNIRNYDYETFGGELMYSFTFEKDNNLSVQHLIEILN